MNPADKTIQELTQSLHQSQETIEQLTKILFKSEKHSQLLERTFRWLAILFICFTLTVFYIGFDWVNQAQATADSGITPKTTPKPGTPKPEVQSCRQAMQLMMVKQAQDLMLTSLTLSKEMQQLPDSDQKKQMMAMNNQLGSKLNNIFPNMDNVFNDNSRIFCQIFLRVDNLTRKLSEFQPDWTVVRKALLQLLVKEINDTESPLYQAAKQALDYLKSHKAIIINDKNQITVLKASTVDNALSTYLAWGFMKGIASLNILDEIQKALKAVPKMDTSMKYMNANMEDMNAHMYYMMRNMGVMTSDMDSTLGRAGRNMPWMLW